jgi:hypothetical protein
MNHSYESVKETMMTRGIDIPESYIEKALREYGLEEFPEVGLSDVGLTRLVKTATDIYHSDVDLIPRKAKRGYLPAPKIKEEKPKKESKLKGIIENIKDIDIPGTLWEITKLVSLPLPTLAATAISGYLTYQDTKNIVASIIIAGVCGSGAATIHYVIKNECGEDY